MMMRRMVVAAVVTVLMLSGCASAAQDGIVAVDAWVRLPAPTAAGQMMQPTGETADDDHSGHMASPETTAPMGNSAAYMVIENNGPADTLISAASDVAASVELHTVEMVDGVMKMRPVEGGIPLPENGTTELKPGGYHIMLIGLQRELQVGDTVDFTLKTAAGRTLRLSAEVRQP